MLEFEAIKTTSIVAPPASVEHHRLHWHAHCALLIFLAALTVLDLVWMAVSDLDIALWPTLGRFAIVGSLLLVAGYYGLSGRSHRICATLLAVAELLLITLSGTMLSYLAIRAGHPMADSLMASWDAIMGLDWPAYEGFVIRHYWIGFVTGVLYPTSILQVLIVVLALGFSGRAGTLVEFTIVMTASAVVTVLIGACLPALGAHYHYGIPDHGISTFIPAIIAAHDGTLRVIDPTVAEGLVVFPSYHTVISIAVIAASWHLRHLRYPAVGVNLVLIAGIPVWGSHHFVDIIAGFFIAVAALVSWRMALRHIPWLKP